MGQRLLLTRDGWLRLLTLAIVLAVGVWIARNTYWEEVTVPGKLGGEALSNPHYGIELLAAKLGIHTHVLVSLGSLPARDGVLFLGHLNIRSVSATQIEALEHWVQGGGRLIIGGYVVSGSTELQRWSGIKFVPMRKPSADSSDGPIAVPPPVAASVGRIRNDCPPMQVSVDGKPSGETLVVCDVGVGNGYTSAKTPSWALRDAAGIQVLRTVVGRGSVTVIGPSQIYSNIGLFLNQHARVLVEASALSRGDDLWVLAPNRAESFAKLLWRLGAPAICCLLVAIGFSIWRQCPRFGPLASEPLLARRSLAEQIRANARFAWRSRSLGALHKAAVRGLEERARQLIEAYELREPAERLALIAARAGIPVEQLDTAMRPVPDRGGINERAAIVLLEQARRSLRQQTIQSSRDSA